MQVLTNKEIVERVNGFFSENNTEAFLAFCEDSIRWTMAGTSVMNGKDAIRKGMEMGDFEANPLITVNDIIAEGDLVACDGEIKMTKKTGEIHHAAYCDVYRFKDGRIQEMTSYLVNFSNNSTSRDTRKKLTTELQATSTDLINTLSAFDAAKINTVPFEGSWTGAQVGDHILKSNTGILHVINGKVEKTVRMPDANTATIKKIFLDFSTQMKSPKEILPSTQPLQKDTLIKSIKANLEGLKIAAEGLELSETCLDWGLPTFGSLTRLEWLYFSVYHTQRHTHQLKNILSKIAGA